MPFRFDEFVALVKAGYTKEEIDTMEKDEQAAAPAVKSEPVPVKVSEPVEDKTEAPAPAEKVPADTDALDKLQAEVAALRKAIQALNVKNAYRTEDSQNVNAESILASIISPQKK